MENERAHLEKAIDWLVTNGFDFAVNLIAFLVIIIIGKVVVSAVCNVIQKTLDGAPNVSDILKGFVVNVAHKILWVIVGMIALQRLGIDIAPLIAGLGVTGFIIGFAFQESLGNLAAGLMIALNQPFKVGDYIESSGNQGTVQVVNMMATTLTTVDNKKVVIPNSQVWGSAITNFTALSTRRVDLIVGISYAADIGKGKQIISDVLKSIDLILDEPEPVVEVVEMGDSSINLAVRPWCNTADYWTVFFRVNHEVKDALDKAGIEIPFPQMDVHHHGLSQGSAS